MPNKDPLLAFEEFANSDPPSPQQLVAGRNRNNFHAFFDPGWLGNVWRGQELYKRCAAEQPEFVEVAEKLRARTDVLADDYVLLLYEAYKHMYPYAESNYELFK